MKKILLYNPAITTLNIGDCIILEGIRSQIKNVLKDAFVIDVSTRSHYPKHYRRYLCDAEYKFLCGTNILMGKLNTRYKSWEINLFDIRMLKPIILLGVGWWQYHNLPNQYTKLLYKRILSTEYIHSVRDDYTRMQLSHIGITNVLNTSCPTMWSLTRDHCQQIPTSKSDSAICTLTDYMKDPRCDEELLKILLENYKNVYFWIQGIDDYKYISTFRYFNDLKLIPPSLNAYDEILNYTDLDYIGTRLHAGIRALQKKKRTFIIAIDNRAIEKKKDFNIPCIERSQLSDLREIINSQFKTEIVIPEKNIEVWLSQFGEKTTAEKWN